MLPATLPTRRGSSADVTVDPPPSAGNSMVAYPRQPNPLPDHEEWAAVSASIRRGGGTLFWELFAGVAILTAAFSEEGWVTGLPVDVYISSGRRQE